jgi:hypothetical protein
MGKGVADHALRPINETTTFSQRKESASVAHQAVSEDDKAIETLCRAMYERVNERDFNSMYQMLAIPCKSALTASDIGNGFASGGTSYKFVAMESITYQDGPSGKLAKARVRRVFQNTMREGEGVLEDHHNGQTSRYGRMRNGGASHSGNPGGNSA